MPETMRFAVYPAPELAIRAAADLFTALAPQTVALAGGNTPKELYGLLASDDYRDRTDWHELEIYYGDERAVPPNHPDSNYGMARRALLDLVPIEADSVYRMEADDTDLEAAGDRYAQLLPQHLDLVLLGMGTDGHTASLFPGDDACDEQERRVRAGHRAERLEAADAHVPGAERRSPRRSSSCSAPSKRDALRRIRERRAAAGGAGRAGARRRHLDRRRRRLRRVTARGAGGPYPAARDAHADGRVLPLPERHVRIPRPRARARGRAVRGGAGAARHRGAEPARPRRHLRRLEALVRRAAGDRRELPDAAQRRGARPRRRAARRGARTAHAGRAAAGTIAIPGRDTTAFLLLQLAAPGLGDARELRYDRILAAVADG